MRQRDVEALQFAVALPRKRRVVAGGADAQHADALQGGPRRGRRDTHGAEGRREFGEQGIRYARLAQERGEARTQRRGGQLRERRAGEIHGRQHLPADGIEFGPQHGDEIAGRRR